ncbi:MFS transporter [Parafrankia sp. FMc2]|uniref:MFS transporter n=1 Tax=Parafrankia sp. FMc2 TaxID=3233196 RepID=UPI003B58A4FB
MTADNHRAGTREWLGLAILALPTLLLSIDVSVLHLAVPHITTSLEPSASEMLWIIDIYGFLLAASLVTMGTLGDRVGRRKLLLIGAAAFGVLSLAAAWADGPILLIAARAALGIAAATLMPSTLALISNMFRDAKERGVAIAVWVTMFSVGIALGPVVGGALLELFWWGSVFLIAVPVMALLLVAGPVLLPEHRDEQAGRLDLVSVVLSLLAILPIVYGLKEIAREGGAVIPVLAIVVGLIAAVAFVHRQRTLTNPVLDVGLFRQRAFVATLATMLVAMLVAGGTYLFVTQYLQLVDGQSPLRAGLWLLPAAFALIVTSIAAPMAVSRFAPSTVVCAGLLLSAVGHAMLALVPASGGLTLLVIAFALVYGGGGPLIALGTDLVVGSVLPEQAGSAAAISETSTELGMALGVATLGSVGTAIYRGQLTLPEGLPADATDSARDTLAGALASVEGLAGPAGEALAASARDAFTDGLNVIGLISALVSVALAVLFATNTRSRPATESASVVEDAKEIVKADAG